MPISLLPSQNKVHSKLNQIRAKNELRLSILAGRDTASFDEGVDMWCGDRNDESNINLLKDQVTGM